MSFESFPKINKGKEDKDKENEGKGSNVGKFLREKALALGLAGALAGGLQPEASATNIDNQKNDKQDFPTEQSSEINQQQEYDPSNTFVFGDSLEDEEGDKKSMAIKLAEEKTAAEFFRAGRQGLLMNIDGVEEAISIMRKKDPKNFIAGYSPYYFVSPDSVVPDKINHGYQMEMVFEENPDAYKSFLSDRYRVPVDSLQEHFDNILNKEVVFKDTEDAEDAEDGGDEISEDLRREIKERHVQEQKRHDYREYLDAAFWLQNIKGVDVLKNIEIIKEKDLGFYLVSLPGMNNIRGIDNMKEIEFIRKNNVELFIENISELPLIKGNFNLGEQINLMAKENPEFFLMKYRTMSDIFKDNRKLSKDLFNSVQDLKSSNPDLVKKWLPNW